MIHSFDGFRFSSFGRRETLAEYTVRELDKAASRLDLDVTEVEEHPVTLPDLDDPEKGTGIRVFVSLKDNRMRAYQAPVVEVVPMTDNDWVPLRYPVQTRTVEAATLKDWLSQIYPSGVMERTNPRTKKVYQIQSTEGELSLAPAGKDEHHRYATLIGKVTLTDEGSDPFSYRGQLEIVLTYDHSEPKVQTLRGVFEGIYPRTDRRHQHTRLLPLTAAIESRPK